MDLMSMADSKTAATTELPAVEQQRTLAAINAASEAVAEKIAYLFDGLVLNASDALFEEMRQLEEQEALRQHFNVMRFLKVHQDHVQVAFFDVLDGMWAELAARREVQLPVPEGLAAEFIDHNGRKVSQVYRVLIQDIRGRLSALLAQDFESFPIDPESFYIAWWQSMADTELTYAERQSMMVLFHRFVMDRYGQVLAAANVSLANMGVDVEQN